MKRNFPVICCLMISLLISSCGPGQLFGPSLTSTPTITLTPTTTSTPPSTPTNTAVPTLTLTPQIQPSTPTPFPNLGIKTSDAVNGMNFMKGVTFVDIPDVDGQAAQKAEMPKDFTTVTFIGEPYLTRAELRIDLSKLKDIDILNMYIVSFVMSTSSDGGFEAQDWARHSLSEAAQKGRIEKSFGKSKIVIEIEDGIILNLIVLPADNL